MPENNRLERWICGGAIGLFSGLFGGGGGMIAVPLLARLGYAQKQAHATAILIILPVCVFSFILYALEGYYSGTVLIPTALGVTLGGVLGANLLGKLPTKTVGFIFAILQAVAGAFLLFY